MNSLILMYPNLCLFLPFFFQSKLSWCRLILGWFHHQQYDCLPSWELCRETWRSDQSIGHIQYAFCYLSLHCMLLATQGEEKFGSESCSGKSFDIRFVIRILDLLVQVKLCQYLCKGDPRPHLPPHVMVLSALVINQIGGLWVFANHTCKNKRKTNAYRIFACHAAFYGCLSSSSDRSRCRWHTHLTNHG